MEENMLREEVREQVLQVEAKTSKAIISIILI